MQTRTVADDTVARRLRSAAGVRRLDFGAEERTPC